MGLQVGTVTERPQSVLCVVVCIIVSFLLHREPDSPTGRHNLKNRGRSTQGHLHLSWECCRGVREMDWSGCPASNKRHAWL